MMAENLVKELRQYAEWVDKAQGEPSRYNNIDIQDMDGPLLSNAAARIEDLEEALEFYAAETTYMSDLRDEPPDIWCDRGETASKTLEGEK